MAIATMMKHIHVEEGTQFLEDMSNHQPLIDGLTQIIFIAYKLQNA